MWHKFLCNASIESRNINSCGIFGQKNNQNQADNLKRKLMRTHMRHSYEK